MFSFNAAQAKGVGYAISTTEELKFVKEVAEATGVILDPVYRFKMLYSAVKILQVLTAELSIPKI